MDVNIENLPNWTFQIDETSAGVYKLIARHALGCSIELTGADPDRILDEAKRSANEIEDQLRRKAGPKTHE